MRALSFTIYMDGIINNGKAIIREYRARKFAGAVDYYMPAVFAVSLTIALFLADIALTMAGAFQH